MARLCAGRMLDCSRGFHSSLLAIHAESGARIPLKDKEAFGSKQGFLAKSKGPQTESGLQLHREAGLGFDHPALSFKHKEAPVRLASDNSPLPCSAYIHLPFCRRRCFYCDFAIMAVGEHNDLTAPRIDSTMESYVDSVCAEITSTLQPLPACELRPLKTVFFGGGTPSLVPPRLVQKIIDCLESCCGIETDAEMSMEMDPGTFDQLSLRQFMDCGVNRVSVGIQAFQDDLLKACGRSHGLQDVHNAIDIMRTSGLKNWSLDLICSLPYQTLGLWEESLCKAIEAEPTHVSVYDLQVEEGTKFWQWYKAGQHPLPDEVSSAAFYRLASKKLKDAGYEHYEISNYAKPGYQCKHNLVYWLNQPYYAFGLGAASYVRGHRFSRPRKWKAYFDFVKSLEHSSHVLKVINSLEDLLCDTIMLSLRLAEGLNLVDFTRTFGMDVSLCICTALLPFVQSGHALALDLNRKPLSPELFASLLSSETILFAESGLSFIRLADPEGFLLSNEIISSIFSHLPNN